MLKDKVQEHHAALYGNGKDGILDFIAGLQGQMRLILLLLAAITAIAGVAMVVATIEVAKHAQMDPAKIFHSTSRNPVLSSYRPLKSQVEPRTFTTRRHHGKHTTADATGSTA